MLERDEARDEHEAWHPHVTRGEPRAQVIRLDLVQEERHADENAQAERSLGLVGHEAEHTAGDQIANHRDQRRHENERHEARYVGNAEEQQHRQRGHRIERSDHQLKLHGHAHGVGDVLGPPQ